MSAPLIGFEGPIAAGKTTLAKLLATHTSYDLFLERFDENEFLHDFYQDSTRWALPMQLWFLGERHKQFLDIAARSSLPIVADYTPIKNDVFAGLLLREREWRLYDSLSRSLGRAIRHPDLIVYLDAPNDVLLQRIGARNRAYEAHIDERYLDSLRIAYEATLASLTTVTTVRRDTSLFELSDSRAMDDLFAEILHAVSRPPSA